MDLSRYFSGRITEVIVTTTGAGGECHAAPIGIRRDGDSYHIRVFSSTDTSENAIRARRLCANFTINAASWVKSVTGGFTEDDFESASGWDVPSLSGTYARVLFECSADGKDRLDLRPLDSWHAGGMVPQVNRGFNALIEAAVLFTRREFLQDGDACSKFEELRRIGSSCGNDDVIEAFNTLFTYFKS